MHESVALIFFCCYPHPYIVVCDVIRIPVMREVYIYVAVKNAFCHDS